MQLFRILTPLVASALLATTAPLAVAQNRGDDTLLEMQQAFRKGDRKKLEQLLPAARGHALEPWAAYWELKARLGAEANRSRVVRDAVEIVAPDALPQLKEVLDAPTKYLLSRATAQGKMRQELVLLALIKLASGDPDGAAQQLDSKWSVHLSPEERNWAGA